MAQQCQRASFERSSRVPAAFWRTSVRPQGGGLEELPLCTSPSGCLKHPEPAHSLSLNAEMSVCWQLAAFIIDCINFNSIAPDLDIASQGVTDPPLLARLELVSGAKSTLHV